METDKSEEQGSARLLSGASQGVYYSSRVRVYTGWEGCMTQACHPLLQARYGAAVNKSVEAEEQEQTWGFASMFENNYLLEQGKKRKGGAEK